VALTCVRCGAQNPDGNAFCESCGAPLAAPGGVQTAVLTGPPPGMAPPPFSSPGYQSPYYAPSGVAAPVPVHRTPRMLIIAAVVAVSLILGGVGTVLALVANHEGNPAGGSAIGDIPSPSPDVSPSAVASATPTPTLGSTTESNDGFSVPVPQGWSVAAKDSETIVLADPNGQGSVSIGSGPSVPTQTAQDNKNTVDGYFKSKYPDSRPCPSTSAQNTVFSGASGISWTVCFTLTSGSNTAPAAASLFAGANKSGSVYYVVMVLTRQDNLQSYLNVTKPVLQGVHWKLS
jgi:zinc-ribbon domain